MKDSKTLTLDDDILPYGRITSPRLRAVVDTLDKNQFIKSYIQSQRTYASSYAADGMAACSIQEQSQPTISGQTSTDLAPRMYRNAFDTPILKPRAPRLSKTPATDFNFEAKIAGDTESDLETTKKPIHEIKQPKKTTSPTPASRNHKGNNVSLSLEKTVKPASKKRTICKESESGDHTARE